MKLWKQLTQFASLSLILTACVSTQQINSEAASEYQQFKQEVASKGALDTQSNTAKRIYAVFNKMRPYAERENKTGVPFHWEVIVVKDNDLNAWAMPGGKMMFYTGLVERLQLNDDEIATVMGHEMIHALNEHSKSDRTFSAVTSIGGQIADAAIAATTGINTGGLVSTGVDLFASKPFSRSQESEADKEGLFLMAKAGYDPKAAPNLWVKMAKASGGGGGFFSTHPSDSDRRANLEKWMPKALEYYQAR